MMASTMAIVGTSVGFVHPGSLSFVHSDAARATRTRVALSKTCMVLLPVLEEPRWFSCRTWLRICW